MKTRFVLILGVAGVLLLGAACEKKATNTNGNTNDDDYPPVVIDMSDEADVNVNGEDGNRNVNSNTNTATNSNSSSNANSNTNTSANEDDAVSGTLSVSDPENGKELESPFSVEGKSAADKVYVSVVSKSGATIFTVPVTVRNGVFKASITFDFSNTTDGTVQVFEKDVEGNTTNTVRIEVTFKGESSDDSDTNLNSNSNGNQNTNVNDNENVNENDNGNTNTDDGY